MTSKKETTPDVVAQTVLLPISKVEGNKGQIKGLPKNPRVIKDEQYKSLKKSIIDAPEMLTYRELLVYPHDGKYVVIGGNMRLKVLQDLGEKMVPCKVLPEETSVEKLKEYTIKDNVSGGLWDWDDLANEWEMDELKGWGMELPTDWGMTAEETPEAVEDEFDESEVKEAIAKEGDIWKLGNHRLMCGDSTDAGSVALLMEGVKADMVFTDPPYNFETEGGGILGKANSMKQVRENKVDKFDPSKLTNYAPTNIYFHNRALIKSYIELAERENLCYDLAIYKKRGLPNYKGHLMTDIEYIAIIGKQDPNKGLELNFYSKVFEGNKDKDNELSYSKPIAICEKFIRLYSSDRQSILDLFGGSGTTLIAAEQLNRRCYMMELDPHYCDVIIARWEKLTGKKAERIKNINE